VYRAGGFGRLGRGAKGNRQSQHNNGLEHGETCPLISFPCQIRLVYRKSLCGSTSNAVVGHRIAISGQTIMGRYFPNNQLKRHFNLSTAAFLPETIRNVTSFDSCYRPNKSI
jgi:hypothetical protein